MCRGDRAFCSVDCRCKQIFTDEEEAIQKGNCSSSTPRHHRKGTRNRGGGGGFAYWWWKRRGNNRLRAAPTMGGIGFFGSFIFQFCPCFVLLMTWWSLSLCFLVWSQNVLSTFFFSFSLAPTYYNCAKAERAFSMVVLVVLSLSCPEPTGKYLRVFFGDSWKVIYGILWLLC